MLQELTPSVTAPSARAYYRRSGSIHDIDKFVLPELTRRPFWDNAFDEELASFQHLSYAVACRVAPRKGCE